MNKVGRLIKMLPGYLNGEIVKRNVNKIFTGKLDDVLAN